MVQGYQGIRRTVETEANPEDVQTIFIKSSQEISEIFPFKTRHMPFEML